MEMGSPRGTSLSSSCTKLGEAVDINSGIPELTNPLDIWYHSTSPRPLWLVITSTAHEPCTLTRRFHPQDLIIRWVKNVPLTN